MRSIIFCLLISIAPSCFAQPKVSYSVTACKIGTNTKLTAMTVGQSFDLVMYVQDLRPSGNWQGTKLANGLEVTGTWPLIRGVFAAYCDVIYDKRIARPTFYSGSGNQAEFLSAFTFSDGYVNGPPRASDSPDRINDVGAFTSAFGGNQAPQEVWRLRMTCKGPGSLEFRPDVSDLQLPQCLTLVYGNDAAQPPEPSYVAPAEIVLIPSAITVSQ